MKDHFFPKKDICKDCIHRYNLDKCINCKHVKIKKEGGITIIEE